MEVESLLGKDKILVVDLSQPQVHRQLHVPDAVRLDYGQIVAAKDPVFGLLPDIAVIEKVLSDIGIDQDTHVIAYDDEGGGKAARLQWTLDALGHHKHSLMNGCIHAWSSEGFPVTQATSHVQAKVFKAKLTPHVIADADYILPLLDDPHYKLLDARSEGEFNGSLRYAQKVGHIPHAIHWDWVGGMDQDNNMRMRSKDQLLSILAMLGIEKEHEVITYCQTHHRSSYTYILLKILGFESVRGYHGAWSEWGNRKDTPVES